MSKTNKTTSSQRSFLDIAMELTQIFFKKRNPENEQELCKVFISFYALAEFCNSNYLDVKTILPEEITKQINFENISFDGSM